MTSPTLPGFERVRDERIEAAALALADDLTMQLRTPLASISKLAGEMERNSPLFVASPANPQPSLFTTASLEVSQ